MNIAYAAASFEGTLSNINRMIINPLILFLFALAIAFFLYGTLQFFANPENEEKKTTGKKHMIWGIIGLTIMMGVFFIMNLILNTLGIKNIKPETGDVKLDSYNPTYPPNN